MKFKIKYYVGSKYNLGLSDFLRPAEKAKLRINDRGGVETRCFESKRDFGVARLSTDETLENRDRNETRDFHINYFGLSQDCGVRVGSRSRMFLVGVGYFWLDSESK